MMIKDSNGEFVSVESTPAGYLKCDFHDTYWCLHIEAVIREDDDARDDIWEFVEDEDTSSQDGLHLNVMVPIVPTKNIWLDVLLKYVKVGNDYFAEALAQLDGEDSERTRIGYLHPGEARNTLRSMAIQWFYSYVPTGSLHCKATSHGFKQSLQLSEDMKNPSLAFAQMWSMWKNETCLGCTFSLDDFDDDLVPQDVTGVAKFGKP